MAKFYMATLVRGSTYVQGSTFYRKDNPPVQVTKAVKEYLEKTAVDDFAIPDGNGGTQVQKLQKFSFTEVIDEDEAPKKVRKAATAPTKAETEVKEEAEESEEDEKEEATKEDAAAETAPVKTNSRSRS